MGSGLSFFLLSYTDPHGETDHFDLNPKASSTTSLHEGTGKNTFSEAVPRIFDAGLFSSLSTRFGKTERFDQTFCTGDLPVAPTGGRPFCTGGRPFCTGDLPVAPTEGRYFSDRKNKRRN